MAIRKPFCVLPLALSDLTTNNARSNRGAKHLALPQYPGMRWQTEGSAGGVFVRGRFGGATRALDFVAIMAANAQPGTTFRLRLGLSQAEVDGVAPYDSGALPFIVPSHEREDGLYHSHLELPAIVNASWWRIDIGGHTGDFSASALIMGTKRTPAYFYNWDRELGYEDLGALDIGRNGVIAETPGVVLKTMLFRLGWVSEEEWWSTWAPIFAGRGKRQCMFWCFDPEATVRRQEKSYLGFMGRDLFMRGGTAPTQNEVDVQFRALL